MTLVLMTCSDGDGGGGGDGGVVVTVAVVGRPLGVERMAVGPHYLPPPNQAATQNTDEI